jgi:hypothetical protein
MSDDDNGSDGRDFEDEARDAIDAGGLFADEKPDIEDYFNLGVDREYYEEAWNNAPVESMTEGQLETFAEMLADAGYELTADEWEEMLDEMWEDFWEWWEAHYEDR